MSPDLLSGKFRKRLRYVPLLSAGVLVFLGLVMLGDLTGLLWFIFTFDWWIRLNPFVIGPTADWVIWGLSFLLTTSPSILALSRERMRADPVMGLTSAFLPLISLITIIASDIVAGILLIGTGFLAAYTLISRSKQLLGIERGSSLRIVCAEVCTFLTAMALGGAVSVLLWREDFLVALISGSNLEPADPLLKMLAIDMEVFYLGRPLLPAIFIALAVVAIATLFIGPLRSVARASLARFLKWNHDRGNDSSWSISAQPASKAKARDSFPYLILAGSLALGAAITLYPYTVAGVRGVLGSDSWFYLLHLNTLRSLGDAVPLLRSDRGFFILLLFLIKTVTGLSSEWVVRLMPTLLSILLAISSFALVKEGTGRLWVAGLAAVLSVLSAQTALGMSAGIITNWFALSLGNFLFALIVRSVRLRSRLAAVGSLALSLLLLATYGYLWVIIIAELLLVVLASIAGFRMVDRREWKYELGLIGSLLFGSIAIPIGLFFAVAPLLGFQPQGLDPLPWFRFGWANIIETATPQALGSPLLTLERAFLFAGNRIDLPFLTVLSIIGLLDQKYQMPVFRRIIATTIPIPAMVTVMTPGLFFAWRGLYIIPLYLTGALGAESLIRRVNGQEPPWKTRSGLVFAGTFAAYLFLSHLSYSLRALELLILVGGR